MTLEAFERSKTIADSNTARIQAEQEIADEIRQRLIKSFLDIIIFSKMTQLGYLKINFFISIIEREHNIRLSPGTVYPLFHELERKGLIKKIPCHHTKKYTLTDKGKKILDTFRSRIEFLQSALIELLNDQ